MKEEGGETNNETEVDRLIGANVQKFRTHKGMTQAQLAQAMSAKAGQVIHQQTILKIEKGQRPMRYSEAMLIAEALEVPLMALAPDRMMAREQQNIDVAWIDTAVAFRKVMEGISDYLEAAKKLKVVLDQSPNAEKLCGEKELVFRRWMSEGDFVRALEASQAALAAMPETPDLNQIF